MSLKQILISPLFKTCLNVFIVSLLCFLTLSNGEKFAKARLVYLLQNGTIKSSSDIRQRFIAQNKFQISTASSDSQDLKRNEIVSKGDYILIRNDNRLYHGRVTNFQHLNSHCKRAAIFYRDFIRVPTDDRQESKKIGILLDPIFLLDDSLNRQSLRNKFLYFESIGYLCHLGKNTDFSVRFIKDVIKNL